MAARFVVVYVGVNVNSCLNVKVFGPFMQYEDALREARALHLIGDHEDGSLMVIKVLPRMSEEVLEQGRSE